MNKPQMLAYKNRLLNAGVPYAVMKRNLRELQDHHDDLVKQARARGMTDAAATAEAARQLGDCEQLVNAMLSRPELRSKLHRYPCSTTILLPLVGHFFICVLLVLAVLYPFVITQWFDRIDRVNGVNVWLIPVFEMLRLALMYLVTPVLGCYLVFSGIRNHVPPRFWITGVILLSLLGSFTQVHTGWGDAANGERNSLGILYLPGPWLSFEEMTASLALRFPFNLLCCGAFALIYGKRERVAAV